MKNNYTQQDISQFLNSFKALPDFYKFEKVHQLVYNPDARARHSIKINYKPLKFIMMTSITVLSFTALMFWLGQGKPIQGTVQPTNLQIDSTYKGSEEGSIKGKKIQPVRYETTGSTVSVANSNHNMGSGLSYHKKSDSRLSFLKGFPGEPVISAEMGMSSDSHHVSKQLYRNASGNEFADPVKSGNASIIDGIHFIELSKPELQRLGFRFDDNRITIITDAWMIFLSREIEGCSFLRNSQVGAEGTGFPVASGNSDISANPPIQLVFMSDEMGFQRIQWKSNSDDQEKFTQEYFLKKIQFLIPVLIRQNDYPYLTDGNRIFWFEPSQALFDSLPANIGKQIKQEYACIADDTSEEKRNLSTSCTYFEACKSTLETSNLSLYPNPASLSVNIAFNLSEEVKGSISLVSIGGVQLKYMVPATTFNQGSNVFTIDVSDIDPGMYLVLLSTSKGFKTQRLIIQR
jgi:hypothetical protein